MINISEIEFNTIERPKFTIKEFHQKGKRQGLMVFAGMLGLLVTGILVSAPWLMVSGFFLFFPMLVYAYMREKKYLAELFTNGTLTINEKGFVIETDTYQEIPYESIKTIWYKDDKPRAFMKSRTKVGTYFFKILLKDGSATELFLHYKPTETYPTSVNDFSQIMEQIRSYDYYFHENIRHVKLY